MVGKDFPFATELMITAAVTVACALLSWHLVEHPALRLKPYLSARIAWPRLFGRYPRG